MLMYINICIYMLMYIYDIYMLMYINISKHMIIYVYIYICVYDV